MAFNSLEFAVFLLVAFLLYWFVFSAEFRYIRRAARLQNFFLVFASYSFYGLWNWRFLGLVVLITLIAYFGGILVSIPEPEQIKGRKKVILIITIILALLPLLIFKYYNFFISSLAALIPAFGDERLLLKIILPLGISFYTFSALSYVIDVYQKKIGPTRDLIQFAAYVSFFPQLLAGPIGKSTDLLPQYAAPRTFNADFAIDGLRQFLWGLFKKVVIADSCAIYVDQIWASYETQSGSTLLLAAVLYSIQIYGDFSGLLGYGYRHSQTFWNRAEAELQVSLFQS